jgi:hypothetical protein
MADPTAQARKSAIKIIARDLRIALDEAQGWCEAWERFAEQRGVPRGRFFWDAGRGWIDAQRSFDNAKRLPKHSVMPQSRPRVGPPIASARRIDLVR